MNYKLVIKENNDEFSFVNNKGDTTHYILYKNKSKSLIRADGKVHVSNCNKRISFKQLKHIYKIDFIEYSSYVFFSRKNIIYKPHYLVNILNNEYLIIIHRFNEFSIYMNKIKIAHIDKGIQSELNR